jgi:hypothetical protein
VVEEICVGHYFLRRLLTRAPNHLSTLVSPRLATLATGYQSVALRAQLEPAKLATESFAR